MTDIAFIVCFLLLLAFGVYIGFLVGNWGGEHAVTAREYWAYNILAVVGCALAVGFIAWPVMLYAVPLGFLPGCITGLKMGFGESSGFWKPIDRFFNINKAHRETAERGTGAARRQRKRTGASAPDVISVANDAPAASSQTGKHAGAANGKHRKKR